MNFVLEANEPIVQTEFKCKRNKQKFLIDVLIRYSQVDFYRLAELLDEPVDVIKDVYHGRAFLEINSAKNLALLFLINFSG
jgi:hypothetical protein